MNDTFVKLVSWYDNEWGKFTTWHRRSLHFLMLPHVLNFLLSIPEVMQLKEKFQQAEAEENEDVVRKAQNDIYYNKRLMVKHIRIVIQMLHVLPAKGTDDWYVVIMGMARHLFG